MLSLRLRTVVDELKVLLAVLQHLAKRALPIFQSMDSEGTDPGVADSFSEKRYSAHGSIAILPVY